MLFDYVAIAIARADRQTDRDRQRVGSGLIISHGNLAVRTLNGVQWGMAGRQR